MSQTNSASSIIIKKEKTTAFQENNKISKSNKIRLIKE